MAGIFEARFRMELAIDGAFMTAEIFGRNEYQVVDVEPNHEMGSILELIQYVAPQVGHVPTHTEGGQGTQDAAGVEFPGVIRVVEITVGSEVVMRDHGICTFRIKVLRNTLHRQLLSLAGVMSELAGTQS